MSAHHTISLPLPNDQWKTELEYWQNISLAQLQRTIVEYGTGQIAAQPQYLLPPSTDPDRWICQNLMIRSTVYQSFSILALSLILVLGMSVIVLSLRIEAAAAWLWRRLNLDSDTAVGWKDHGMLGEQAWRTRLSKDAYADHNQSPQPPSAPLNMDIAQKRRASSQALSLGDSEMLLIARAYDSWI